MFLAGKTTNECYDIFLEYFEFGCNKFIPKRKSTLLQKFDAKWFNKGVEIAIKAKYKAFVAWRAASLSKKKLLKYQFNKACRLVKKQVFKAIINYERSIADSCKSSLKPLYNYINSHKRNKDRIRSLSRADGSLTTDKNEIVEILNDQFFSAFGSDKPIESIPRVVSSDKRFEGIDSSVFDSTAIGDLLRRLDRKKPAGTDNIHPFILSECSSSLSLPISLIFNRSYDEGEIPVSWSLANISPIF